MTRRAAPQADTNVALATQSKLLWVVPGAVLFITAAIGFVVTRGESDLERVEREHNIELPASADNVQALGDASHPVLRLTNLDRGASSIFTLNKSEVDDLLDEFDLDQAIDRSGAPANAIYQPIQVPWATGQKPYVSLETMETPGSADYVSIEIFDIDADTVGVWLYSDWN